MNDPFMSVDVLFGYQPIGTVIGTFTLPSSFSLSPAAVADRGMYCFCRMVSDYRIAKAATEIRTERSRLPLPDDNAYGISLALLGENSKRTL